MSIEPFLQFADLLAEATLLVSGSGVVLAANRGVAHRLGLNPQRLRGKRLADVTANDPAALANYLRACARTREPVPGAFDLVRADGTTLACRGAGAVLRPRAGDVEALIVIRLAPREADTQFAALNQKVAELQREVQRRVRVEQELRDHREWLGVTLASIGDAVIATDTAGAVMFMNPVAEALTGWAQDEALGRPLGEVFVLIDEETRRPIEGPVAAVLRSGTIVALANHGVLIARDGTEVAIDDSAAPIGREGDDARGVVLVFHDIEERRRLERELRQRADALALADRQKNEFLAMLAHELRNPLAPISNALAVLGQGDRRDRAADLDWALAILSRQVRHMARLVDDLLDMSRITGGKIVLRREPVALSTLVAHAVEAAQPLIASKRHELVVTLPDRPVLLHADPARLEQVLCNLLNNAAKYTGDAGLIRLDAALDDDGRSLTLRVLDNGIGIDPEVLPGVFELFRQADRSLDRSQGGLGIGLTLVRTLVALHGGSVEAHSAGHGRGSEFVVRLPVAAPAAASPTAPAAIDGRGVADAHRSRRVLVVDDIIDSARSLARLLRRWGHEVSVAHDGPTALDAIRSTAPEVVLLDIGLPGMDGYEVARRLRHDPGRAAILLIALTGYGQSTDRQQARDAGFDRHLVKPVDPDLLRDLLDAPDPRSTPCV